jgi:hypothetical protein
MKPPGVLFIPMEAFDFWDNKNGSFFPAMILGSNVVKDEDLIPYGTRWNRKEDIHEQ